MKDKESKLEETEASHSVCYETMKRELKIKPDYVHGRGYQEDHRSSGGVIGRHQEFFFSFKNHDAHIVT
jgi:hypothetical protein